jgi:hypothetical protein
MGVGETEDVTACVTEVLEPTTPGHFAFGSDTGSCVVQPA